MTEQAIDTAHLEGTNEKSSKAEGDTFRRHGAEDCRLKTVTEIDMHHAIGDGMQHQVTWMAITEAEDVPEHRHDGERSDVGGAAIEPCFGVGTLDPHKVCQIHPVTLLERAIEDFGLLHEGQLAVSGLIILLVGDVSELAEHVRLAAHLGGVAAVFVDDLVEGVAVLDPLDDASSVTERDNSHGGDGELLLGGGWVGSEESVGETDELDDSFILTKILQTLEEEGVALAVGSKHGELARPGL